MSNINNELLFSDLFAYYVALTDDMMAEADIIKTLKYYLLDENHIPENEINSILYNFYDYYGMTLNMQTIENVTINSISQNHIINQLISYLNPQNDMLNQIFNMPINVADVPANIPDNNLEEKEEEDDEIPPLEHVPAPMFHVTFNNIMMPPINSNVNHDIHNPMVNMLNLMINSFNQPINNVYENVKVATDPEDIDKLKIRVLDTNMSYDCAVCLSAMEKGEEVMELTCSHTFHKQCIEPYLKDYSYKCPVCRSEVGRSKAEI
jgi:hypothetical protein